MSYIEECLEKFDELPQELQDFLNSKKVLKVLDEIEEEYNADLTLALVLIFINELEIEDLSVYIKEKYKFDISTINRILIKIEDNIFKGIAQSFSEDKPEKDYLLDLNHKEKIDLVSNIFSENILGQFSLPEDHLLRLNAIIFELIGKDEQILNKLIKLFLESEEEVSDKEFFIKGKKEKATISNWVKDFVSYNGSDIFSAITLAKYLSSSKNISFLDFQEKHLLRNILKIYRNLVFFPDSMENSNYVDWEIFPVNRDFLNIYKNKKGALSLEANKEKGKNVNKDSNFTEGEIMENLEEQREEKIDKKDQKKLPDKKVFQKKRTNESKTEKVVLEKKENIVTPMNLADQELNSLQEMLKKYPNKSLERKAIESEIKKRKK
ncbi:MAG: hypothetical protein PHP37_03260 [Patescibacteria group bacterium]|nr:hypothetical protein [Patescibacteria group bacterium]